MLARTSSASSSAVACGWVDTARSTASRCAVTCNPCRLRSRSASSFTHQSESLILDYVKYWAKSNVMNTDVPVVRSRSFRKVDGEDGMAYNGAWYPYLLESLCLQN